MAGKYSVQNEINEASSLLHKPNVDSVDFDKSEHYNSVVAEVLRLCGSAPVTLRREAVKTFKANGYIIRKGDNILFPLGIKGKDESIFEKAQEFQGMRFIKENVHKSNQEPIDNIPFSAGSRNCIG